MTQRGYHYPRPGTRPPRSPGSGDTPAPPWPRPDLERAAPQPAPWFFSSFGFCSCETASPCSSAGLQLAATLLPQPPAGSGARLSHPGRPSFLGLGPTYRGVGILLRSRATSGRRVSPLVTRRCQLQCKFLSTRAMCLILLPDMVPLSCPGRAQVCDPPASASCLAGIAGAPQFIPSFNSLLPGPRLLPLRPQTGRLSQSALPTLCL